MISSRMQIRALRILSYLSPRRGASGSVAGTNISASGARSIRCDGVDSTVKRRIGGRLRGRAGGDRGEPYDLWVPGRRQGTLDLRLTISELHHHPALGNVDDGVVGVRMPLADASGSMVALTSRASSIGECEDDSALHNAPLLDLRTGLNEARSSDAKSCGCSQAAKCPPFGSRL
jgi:hypothetical protein